MKNGKSGQRRSTYSVFLNMPPIRPLATAACQIEVCVLK